MIRFNFFFIVYVQRSRGCITLAYSQQREGMWLAKGIGAKLYFRVSKSHSPKYITAVVLGFEEVLSWIGLLIFYFLHVFICVNPVPTIYLLILYLKRIRTYCKYCMALFAFSVFLSLPSVFSLLFLFLFLLQFPLSPSSSFPLFQSSTNLLFSLFLSSFFFFSFTLFSWNMTTNYYVVGCHLKFWAGE